MKSVYPLLAATLLLAGLTSVVAAPAASKIKVLIVDGQNNHAWATTTPLLRKIMEDTGRFTVDVSTTPPSRPQAPKLPPNSTPEQKTAHQKKLESLAADQKAHDATTPARWAAWRPKFSNYSAVISNYNGETWPAEVRTALVDYVKHGGGFVCYHAANNAFPDWPEYNTMIGIGGWGGRNENSGPLLRLRAMGWIKDTTPGKGGGHGPQHEFVVETHVPEHPIMRGLPAKWMQSKDELYHQLRGPAENVTVLASALSDVTKEKEPMLMIIPYGHGRVFHTTLGHAIDAVSGAGFQVTFARGVEWAATEKVTLPAPRAGEMPADRAGLRPIGAE